MADIETLIPDIHNLLLNGKEVSQEEADAFGKSVSEMIKRRLNPEPREPGLRMSSIGKGNRQLWYENNMPEAAEPMHPNNYMKFLIGDLVEEVLLFLCKQAGHSVEGLQDEVELYGIKGHRDVILDGMTVDAKSASPFSFEKFKTGLTHDKDAFGYLTQIQSYVECGQDDPLVTVKDKGAFLALQKVTGEIVLDIHPKQDIQWKEIFDYKKAMIANPEPPERCYEPVPEGKSGNEKLGVNCSYCAFKQTCWPELRTFLYSNGPVYLTKVVKEPRVPEVINGEVIVKNKEEG